MCAQAIHEFNENTEIKNFICCLQFLANEARSLHMKTVSEVMTNAITQITKLDANNYNSVDRDFADLMFAFKTFVKFYLLGTHSARDELIELISKTDKEGLASYVH